MIDELLKENGFFRVENLSNKSYYTHACGVQVRFDGRNNGFTVLSPTGHPTQKVKVITAELLHNIIVEHSVTI